MKVAYCFRHGFSSVIVDASAFPIDENIVLTKKVVELCQPLDIGVEGELGHVGMADALDGCDESLFTCLEEAALFIKETGVDCLAIAAGTAHGKYPDGFIPKINFDLISRIKESTNGMPIALHGASGSGDENIRRSVRAGINKINVATEIQLACRDAAGDILKNNPDSGLVELLQAMEKAAYDTVSHWISISGSQGKASAFKRKYSYSRLIGSNTVSKTLE